MMPGRKWLDALLDGFFPRYCVHCGDEVDDGVFQFLCPRCRACLDYIEPPHCIACGYPFWGKMSFSRRCPKCVGLDPVFIQGRALFMHRGPGSTMIQQLKYHAATYLKPDLQRILRRRVDLEIWLAGSVLVPVPLHTRKLRERGFNQSHFIARAVAETIPGCRVNDCLWRVRDTETQTRLSAAERRANMKNAFAIAGNAVFDPSLEYILVDDVFTTGSTLNACAAVLERAGAGQPRIFTLAHG